MDESNLPPLPPAPSDASNASGEDEKQLRKKRFWMRFGGEGFLISLGIHVVLAIIALCLAVPALLKEPPPPEDFSAGGGGQRGETARMREYNVKMKQIRNTVRSDKKLTVKNSKNISLADMPALDMSALQRAAMAADMSKGSGGGIGGGSGDGSGSGIGKGSGKNFVSSFLGSRYSLGAEGLIGQFYDFKITPKMQSSGKGMGRANSVEFKDALDKFITGNWSAAGLDKYYCVPEKVTTTQLFFGEMPTSAAPKAFNADSNVGLENWAVVYRGVVRAPFSGEFRFVGYVADGLFVRFNNKLVLESNHRGFNLNPARQRQFKILYEFNNGNDQIRAGSWIPVTVGKEYPIEICIADAIAGTFRGYLLIEQKGVTYPVLNGAPKLPVFRCGNSVPPPGKYPPHDPEGPIFQAVMPKTTNIRR